MPKTKADIAADGEGESNPNKGIPAPLGRAYAALRAAGIDADLGADDDDYWELTVPVVYDGYIESWYSININPDGVYRVFHEDSGLASLARWDGAVSDPEGMVTIIRGLATRLPPQRGLGHAPLEGYSDAQV